MDNYSLWLTKEAREERWRQKQPRCCKCNEHILDDDLWEVFGDLYHEECAEKEFKKKTEWYEA